MLEQQSQQQQQPHESSSKMHFNAPPPPQYEDDTSFFPDFYTTRLGPCDFQDPVWAKMNTLATGNKKKKGSDNKPQSQINKCNNEKRRREQENIYIEELAELISANFADMSSLSVKPDKCAILQETVNQIRSIKQRESAAASSTASIAASSSTGAGSNGGGIHSTSMESSNSSLNSNDPVQQGEVSSSRPTILSNEVYGPLLLEALEGFLFVVNAEGRVEHVTENVATYIKFNRDEIFGKSIYNIIHHGDHARFSANLMPMTMSNWTPMTIGSNDQQTQLSNNGNSSSMGSSGSGTTMPRSRSFSVRFLIKPDEPSLSDNEETGGGSTVSKQANFKTCYELMHISSTQLRDQQVSSSGDRSPNGSNAGSGGSSNLSAIQGVSEEDSSSSSSSGLGMNQNAVASDNSSGPYLLCVASRITNRDKGGVGSIVCGSSGTSISSGGLSIGNCTLGAGAGMLPGGIPGLTCAMEQFTTKLDTTGKVIGIDVTGVSSPLAQMITKHLMDRLLREMVAPSDTSKVVAHLRDAITAAHGHHNHSHHNHNNFHNAAIATNVSYSHQHATSAIYRLQVAPPDHYIKIQTKSKLFKTNNAESDFIMATHSILIENDAIGPSDPGGGNGSNIGNNANPLHGSGNSGVACGSSMLNTIVNGLTNNGIPMKIIPPVVTSSPNSVSFPSSTSGTTSTSISTQQSLSVLPAPSQLAVSSHSAPVNAISNTSPAAVAAAAAAATAAAQAAANSLTLTFDNDFPFDIFPTSTWDQEPNNWSSDSGTQSTITSLAPMSTPINNSHNPLPNSNIRSESRQSVSTGGGRATPCTTPRPPSNPPSYSSPASSGAPSTPTPTVIQQQSSPYGVSSVTPMPQPSPTTPYSNNTFMFSPLNNNTISYEDQQKETKANTNNTNHINNSCSSGNSTNSTFMDDSNGTIMVDSARLRNLLTKPSSSSNTASASPSTAGSESMYDLHQHNHNQMGNSDGNRNKNRILKGLLNQQDDDSSDYNRMSSPRTNSTSSASSSLILQHQQPPHFRNISSQHNNSTGNDMLVQLLNEKNDDDDLEAKAGVKKKSELLEILLKNDKHHQRNEDDDKRSTELHAQDDTLLRSLGFSNSPSPPTASGNCAEFGRGRKRPSDDRDESPIKRLGDGQLVSSSAMPSSSVGSSKLCERNKMLASLLAKQPNNQPIPPIPASVISAIPQEKMPRVTALVDQNLSTPGSTNNKNRSVSNIASQHQLLQQSSQQTIPTSVTNVVRSTAQTTTSTTNHNRMMVAISSSAQRHAINASSYLNAMLSSPNAGTNAQLLRQQQQQMHLVATANAIMSNAAANSSVQVSTSNTMPSNSMDNAQQQLWAQLQANTIMQMENNAPADPLLSDILDEVIDIVPEDFMQLLDSGDAAGQQMHSTTTTGISEKMAINIIQKSLMQCESAVKSPTQPTAQQPTPPAYPTTPQHLRNSGGAFPPPPPNYPQGTVLIGTSNNMTFAIKNRIQHLRPGTPQYTAAATAAALSNSQLLMQQQQNNPLLQQRKQQLLQQQENKRRLLQQQQQQQLLIPPNASASELNNAANLANIDSLLNNTIVPPNVSLQRSSSLPESQLSPNNSSVYSNSTVMQQTTQQIRSSVAAANSTNMQQPFSPHSQLTSPIHQPSTTSFQQGGTGQQFQQQNANSARLSPQNQQFQQQQLSPRQQQTIQYPPQQNPTISTQSNTVNWQHQQQHARLSLQNPMLNAQLTGTYAPPNGIATSPSAGASSVGNANRNYQRGQQQRGSNNSAVSRNVSYSQQQQQASGNETFPPPPNSPTSPFNQQQQNQYIRLQRANATPNSTTQLPGGGNGGGNGVGGAGVGSGNGGGAGISVSGNTGNNNHANNTGAGSGGGPTSEFVRQELRAVVGARTGQAAAAAATSNRIASQLLQQQQQHAVDLEALGLSFEMPPSGASESSKIWGTAMGSEMGPLSPSQPATSRSTLEEAGRQGDHNNKSSLLQKLLSE